jgi:hypothetical protein
MSGNEPQRPRVRSAMGSSGTSRVGRRRPWLRAGRRGLLGLLSALAGYTALVAYPQPLFAFRAARDGVVLHSRSPLPPESGPLLDDVLRRIRRSDLYDPARVHHVFLCDTPALFGLFTLWNYESRGVAATWVTGNVFIRPSSVERGRVRGASGVEKSGERTLAYYVAHELTHAMTADRIGRYGIHRLAAFQREGYADYVAFARPVDVAQGRLELRAGHLDVDPKRSGHYDRYRLLVGYLLQVRHFSVERLLSERLERAAVEAELERAALPPEKSATF